MTEQATPKSYAQAVLLHARTTPELTLYPGHNYRTLADFLHHPYACRLQGHSQSNLAKQNKILVTLHRFSRHRAHEIFQYHPTTADLKALDIQTQPPCECGKVLFLNGFAPPEWLNLIGARYRVDPEFFRQHLSFMRREGQFDLPGLPYASRNIVKLPLYTIGMWNIDRPSKRHSIANEWSEVSRGIASYLRSLDVTTMAGQSIVRKITFHDQKHFTVEQEISICIEAKDRGWTALCWLDGELDLDSTVLRFWNGRKALPRHSHWILPTYMYRPKMALIGPAFADEGMTPYEPSQAFEPTKGNLDSLARLFGRQLNADCAEQDAFYALSELFTLSAFSANQSFNLVEQSIDSQINSSIEDMQNSLEILRQANSFIHGHVVRLQETLAHIHTRGSHAKWPRASTIREKELADSVADEIDHSYQHLLKRAICLIDRIKSESEWLMHKAMLNESQQALSQGYSMSRITFLAFLFIPLSFTASLFGMNVIELTNADGSRLSIWYWVVVSIFVFAASLLTWYWDKIQHFLKNIVFSGTSQKI